MSGRTQHATTGRTPQVATTQAQPRDEAQTRHELKIATDAITRIAAVTTREVQGLHLTEFKHGLLSRLGLSGPNTSPETGIKASINSRREVSLTLSMAADYGVHIPTLAEDLQARLADRIARMTDFDTRNVRIEIVDIYLDGDVTPETG